MSFFKRIFHSKNSSSNIQGGGFQENIIPIPQNKLNLYQDLFYLLQTQPQYLYKCITIISPDRLFNILDVINFSLFANVFSAREEYLLLNLFREIIIDDFRNIENITDFISGQKACILPHVINSYNRREKGVNYLTESLTPILNYITKRNKYLDIDPLRIYNILINEYEIRTGKQSPLPRGVTNEEASLNEDVNKILCENVEELSEICHKIVNRIIESLDKLPYGLRWLMKYLKDICLKEIPDTTEDDIDKVIIYFIYFRYINLAIISPDAFNILNNDISPYTRKTLVLIAKILQNLFQYKTFNEDNHGEKPFISFNSLIDKNKVIIQEYISAICNVNELEDELQYNNDMEESLNTDPIITITLGEISSIHSIIGENISQIISDDEDILNIIINDLGHPIVFADADKHIQLTLTNKQKREYIQNRPKSARK